MEQGTWVPQAEAARVEGVSRQWINELVRRGRLSTDASKRVNLRDVRRVRAEELDPARGKHKQAGGASNSSEFSKARAKREQIEAELAELKLLQQRGELVLAADVRRELAGQLGALRDRLLQVGARVGPVLAPETDLVQCVRIVDAAIHEALEEVARPAAAEVDFPPAPPHASG